MTGGSADSRSGQAGGAQEPSTLASQTAAGGDVSYLQSIDVQMAVLAATIVATALAIIVLQGIKDQQEGLFPCKDYSFIDKLPRVSTAILAAAALYFFYLAWEEHKGNPESKTLTLLFVANALAVGAAIVKLDVLYTAPESDAELEEVIEEVVE